MNICCKAALLVASTLLATTEAAAGGLDSGVGRLAAEARRDLRIENQAALERAPGRFLAGRLPAREPIRWVMTGSAAESAGVRAEIGAPNRS